MNSETIFFLVAVKFYFVKSNVKVSALKLFTVEEHINQEIYDREIERKIKKEKPKTRVSVIIP